MAARCVRLARRSLPALSLCLRPSPRLLCTATKQKSNGQGLEEDTRPSEPKPEPPATDKVLLEEKGRLEEQLRETVEKYKRALADTENLRQRSQKLIEEAKLYGIQGFCKDLLEVADILEKATQSVPKEAIRDENPHLKSLYEGLVMTEVQMQKVFTKHGLLRLDPVGAKFDPYEHEALFHTPVEGKEPGTVALVSKSSTVPTTRKTSCGHHMSCSLLVSSLAAMDDQSQGSTHLQGSDNHRLPEDSAAFHTGGASLELKSWARCGPL